MNCTGTRPAIDPCGRIVLYAFQSLPDLGSGLGHGLEYPAVQADRTKDAVEALAVSILSGIV